MVNINDNLHYLFISNPISQQVLSTAASVAKTAGIIASGPHDKIVKKTHEIANETMSKALPLWKLAGRNIYFVRLAGLSGATAVILGAYGSHRHYNDEKGESKNIFDIGNRFHFFHSALLATVPICRQPILTGSLIIVGTFLFSGTCYYRAFTGKTRYRYCAPMGGFCLILAWLSMML